MLVYCNNGATSKDAFVDKATHRLLTYASRKNAKWIQNNYQPYDAARDDKPQMKAYFHWKEGEVLPLIWDYLKKGKNVFVPCTSQRTGKVVYDMATIDWGLNPDLETGDVIFIRGDDKLNGAEEKAAKVEALLDINKAAKRGKLFIISPSMTVGNSIEVAFDVICGFVEPNSIGARDFLQQLARPRQVTDNQMHIDLNYFGANPRTDAAACLQRANTPRIYEEGYVDYFDNVDSLKREHLEASGPVKLLHGEPALDLETTKVKRAEDDHNNALFFLEVLRKTEVQNRQLDMVDDIWAGLLHMGAFCEEWVTTETDAKNDESADKTIYQMQKQVSMKQRLMVTEVELNSEDQSAIKAAATSYDVTLNDRQRALRTRLELQEEYGLDEAQWEAIQKLDREAVEKSKQSSGSLPQTCWASRYGRDAIDQYRMFTKLLNMPCTGDVPSVTEQQDMFDGLAKQEARDHDETEEDRSTRAKSMYRARTAIDISSLLGFDKGIFDRQQLPANAMLGSKKQRQSVEHAIAKWLLQLEPSANATAQAGLAEEMTRIAVGGEYKKLLDIVKVVNERFLKPSFGATLKASKKRSRNEKNDSDLRPYKLEYKFRIEGISDDRNITIPLVKKTAGSDGLLPPEEHMDFHGDVP